MAKAIQQIVANEAKKPVQKAKDKGCKHYLSTEYRDSSTPIRVYNFQNPLLDHVALPVALSREP